MSRLALSYLLLARLASAQSVLTGTITGPDGARVRNAVVEARTAKGASPAARAISTAKGEYRLSVPANTYEISVTVPCCQYASQTQPGVAVRPGAAQKFDFQLPWGANLGAEGDDPILLLDEFRERAKVPIGPAPRMGGKPDLSGIWINVFNPDLPPPPLQPWAAELLARRIADNSKDYPGGYCLPPNAASITRAFPYEFVQAPNRIVVIYESDTPGFRQIYMDGRKHPAPTERDPTWQGHSVGRWDGDTLVVDTANFNDKAWLSLSGIPHSDKLHVVERIRRLDRGHLEVDITMDDSGAFTAPWRRVFQATLAPPGEEIIEFICAENNRDSPHYR